MKHQRRHHQRKHIRISKFGRKFVAGRRIHKKENIGKYPYPNNLKKSSDAVFDFNNDIFLFKLNKKSKAFVEKNFPVNIKLEFTRRNKNGKAD